MHRLTHGREDRARDREESTPVSLRNRGRRALFVAVVSVSAIAAAACGSDSATGPDNPKSPIGDYSLSTFNGKPIPATRFSDTNFSVVVQAASISLGADGNYKAVWTERETVLNSTSTYVDTTDGTWVQGTTAGTLLFTRRLDGLKLTGTWAGTKITIADSSDGVLSTVVYTRK